MTEPESLTEASVKNWQALPSAIRESIIRGMKAGVTVSFNWRDKRKDEPRGITAIHWQPGDPNPLAECIINNVNEEPIPLRLEDRLFLIQRVHGTLEENELGGQVFKPAD